MTDEQTKVMLSLDTASRADDEELEELTRLLRDELLELDVDDVDIVEGGEAPDGTKAASTFSWGNLLVTMAASGGVLTSLIGAVRSWLSRNEGKSVTLVIGEDRLELSNLSSEEQAKLIDVFVRRHSG